MVNVVMKTTASGRERLQEADFNEGRRVVRVLPTSDDIRRYIKHPRTRVGFPAEGSAEWPNDAFTKRRIIDGDVRIEAPGVLQAAEQQRAIEQKPDVNQTGGKTAKSES
jgi:hypothetical protein